MSGADPDTNGHILLVEDEEDLAAVVKLNLELAGHDVTHVIDGRSALNLAAEERFDLVLLDVMLPVVDGWQVLHELKEDEQTRDIPVVMLTALAGERDIIQGHLEGAVRYVTKPFEVTDLLETVAEGMRPADEDERTHRRERVRTLLQRLAELDAGREAGETTVHLSRLEATPRSERAHIPEGRERLGELTEKQRHVAEELGAGRSARELAEDLGVSRSNVYATRKRIARKLGVTPDEVAETVARIIG